MGKKLADNEITAGLSKLPGWSRQGDAIVKQYSFKAFKDGIRFVDQVAVEADKADHHPDIDIRYTKVTMSLSTHSDGGITQKDLALAEAMERLAPR